MSEITPQQLKCPKCDSDDISMGSGGKPHVCAKGHEFGKEGVQPMLKDCGGSMSEDLHAKTFLKSPEILATFNQKPKSSFEQRLDTQLEEATGSKPELSSNVLLVTAA